MIWEGLITNFPTLLPIKPRDFCSDSSGATPLHYAAGMKDSLIFLKILLTVGRANPTIR